MIEEGSIYKPLAGEIVVVQVGIPKLGTAHWMVRLDSVVMGRMGAVPIVSLEGIIQHAKFVKGIDLQVDTQRASINRLLEHLRQHCPELMGTGKCQHLAG